MCSCGTEPVKTSMNYERPIITMARAINSLDSETYLNCFTGGAKQDYIESESYNPELVKTMLPSITASKSLFKAKILSSKELGKDDIDKLIQEYKDKYKKRINITKAQQITVEFGTMQNNSEQLDTRDLVTVSVENNWLIFGDVIEQFQFGMNAENDSLTAS